MLYADVKASFLFVLFVVALFDPFAAVFLGLAGAAMVL